MSSSSVSHSSAPLDLSKWRNAPNWMIVIGGLLALLGAAVNVKQFSYSWLLAFMFYLSLSLGALFLVLVHHLFDAAWSVPIRRFVEHLANLSTVMAAMFVPIVLNTLLASPENLIYPWMAVTDPHSDHALAAKLPLFTKPMFYLVSAVCFGVWWFLSSRLRFWSLKQDESGAADCTHHMRRLAAVGIFLFAFTLTLGAIMWVKALQHEWFSTMYGVYYFAASVWLTLATVYFIAVILQRLGPLREVLHEHQYYFIGSLLLAFTVFYAYIHFSQYFIIWNANMPEETFWYKLRERGSWWDLSMVIIFGHFFLPFLALLRIDAKHALPLMLPLCAWAWIMHFCDLSFNIMPVLHPDGFALRWIWVDLACLAFIGGVLVKVFIKDVAAHPAYPLRDPRIMEAMGVVHPVASPISGGDLDADDFPDDTSLIHKSQSPKNGGGR